MKRKISIAVLLVVITVGLYFCLHPSKVSGPDVVVPATPPATVMGTSHPQTPPATGTTAVAADAGRDAIIANYRELEAARTALQRRLSVLKTRLWGIKMPAADARRVRETMTAGYVLLKEPRLLGGFRDVAEIQREIQRIAVLNRDLNDIERLVDHTSTTN